jgi:hypothetical protein
LGQKDRLGFFDSVLLLDEGASGTFTAIEQIMGRVKVYRNARFGVRCEPRDNPGVPPHVGVGRLTGFR